MRTADVLEKAVAKHPKLIAKHITTLIETISKMPEEEVQWHVAQLFTRCQLTPTQAGRAFHILKGYFSDSQSNIVWAFSLESLAILAQRHNYLKPSVLLLVKAALHDPSPAVVSKARQARAVLEKNTFNPQNKPVEPI